jgi:tetratricopeptide (TPR) repeat protein
MTGPRYWPFLAVALLVSTPIRAAQQLSDSDISKLLEKGRRVLVQGMPDTAISHYFDPIIASYERQYANEKRAVYVSHSMVEAILYMGLANAAADKSGSTNGAVTIQGLWTDALALKGYALVELQRPDEAKPVLNRAIELSPFYPGPAAELGNIYQNEKNWPAALDAYEKSETGANLMEDGEAKTKALTRAWRGQAFVLTEEGKLDESEALYHKCLSLDPHDGGAKGELEYIASLRAKIAPAATPAPAAAPTSTPSPLGSSPEPANPQ